MFNDDIDYISLFDLSKSKHYSLEFLLKAAVSGKLKAFKMGDDWFTTMDWFDQYNSKLKTDLDMEVDSTPEDSGWVSFVPNTVSRLALVPHALLIIFIFTIFSFSLSWLVLSPGGHRMALNTYNLTSQRYEWGNRLLNSTNLFYKTSSEPVVFVVQNSVNTINRIFDDSFTLANESLFLASSISLKLEPYKMSDEVITSKTHQFIAKIKNRYQSVAGASHIREQIYFDEWKKSVESE